MTEQKAIGPSFASELESAALLGLPFSWSEDGSISFGSSMVDGVIVYQMTQSQMDAVMAVYAAHDPDATNNEALEESVRQERDRLMRDKYDQGVMLVQRMIRMSSDAEQITYLEGKLAELDVYAVALQDVPEQPGFPETVTWPTIPAP